MTAPTELRFRVEAAQAIPFAATPLIALKLRISANQPVAAIALRCQVQIEAQRRPYTAREQAELDELFGEPARWSQTLKPLLWTHASVQVPAFDEHGLVDLLLPCGQDFSFAAAKYFHALAEGTVPLLLLFSGTVFLTRESGDLAIAPVPWSKEARFSLPVSVLKDILEQYYPNSACLLLRRDVFDRLRHFKTNQGYATWEQAIENLLGPAKGESP